MWQLSEITITIAPVMQNCVGDFGGRFEEMLVAFAISLSRPSIPLFPLFVFAISRDKEFSSIQCPLSTLMMALEHQMIGQLPFLSHFVRPLPPRSCLTCTSGVRHTVGWTIFKNTKEGEH